MDLGENDGVRFDASYSDDLPPDRDVLPVWDSYHPLPVSGPEPTGFVPARSMLTDTPRLPPEIYETRIMPMVGSMASVVSLGASSREARRGYLRRYGEAIGRVTTSRDALGCSGSSLLRALRVEELEEKGSFPITSILVDALDGHPYDVVLGGTGGFYVVPRSEGLDPLARARIGEMIRRYHPVKHTCMHGSGARSWCYVSIETFEDPPGFVSMQAWDFDTGTLVDAWRTTCEILDLSVDVRDLRKERERSRGTGAH